MDRSRLLERFLRYVTIDTTAREGAQEYPSSPGQLELGRMLLDELRTIGIEDARQDEHGVVLATIPPTSDPPGPTIAFCAHLDTSPETPGLGVKPQVIENYAGGHIALPGDPSRVIRTDENPELDQLHGCTLITSDGTTLLGADDKAGVAVIVETAAWLAEHPEIPHGPVRICFTCDEEVGRGVDKLDLKQIGAAACYTLDGQGADTIDVETFSADLAVVTVHGVNIHPSIAKDRMTNAVRAAADFLQRLPRDRLSPETTEDRQGFLHPYEIGGGVGEVRLRILLRDFDTARLAEQAELLNGAAAATEREFPGAKIDVNVTKQYRNMSQGLTKEPRAVAHAEEALKRLGRTGQRTIVRGGTDGSRLTELGLPTPNLACGQHTPHSPLEWACLDEMVAAVEWLAKLTEVWAEGEEA
ncbi:MAG TPA: peptidase T [Thermoguttaceae bacterium]|nr:peptidase T [Thermoguttaceae bacterium]